MVKPPLKYTSSYASKSLYIIVGNPKYPASIIDKPNPSLLLTTIFASDISYNSANVFLSTNPVIITLSFIFVFSISLLIYPFILFLPANIMYNFSLYSSGNN